MHVTYLFNIGKSFGALGIIDEERLNKGFLDKKLKKNSQIREVGMDETDYRIIKELQENGRRSYKEIAKKLKVSDGTVRLRTEKMIKEGLLSIKALIDPFKFENRIYALIAVNLERRGHAVKMKQISKLKGVVSVLNPAGRFDLFVEVFLESRKELSDLLLNMFTKVGVIGNETFIYLDGIDRWIALN